MDWLIAIINNSVTIIKQARHTTKDETCHQPCGRVSCWPWA